MKNKMLSGMLQKMNAGQSVAAPEVEFENLNDSLAAKIKGGMNDSASVSANDSGCNESSCNNSGCGIVLPTVPIVSALI